MGTAADSPLAAIRRATIDTLHLPKDDWLVSDYLVCAIVSNVWSPDADPLWCWLIGPPGSYKTELIRTLEDYAHVHYLSSISGAALVSGYDRAEDHADMSMLPKLHRKVLTIKDFTAILGSSDQTLKQIFGDFRDAYDGSYGKHFGTVGERKYRVKFGMLAAVTPAIDKVTIKHILLGERFLAFRVCRAGMSNRDTRLAMLRHVQSAMSGKAEWRRQLKAAWQSNLDDIVNNLPSEVDFPAPIREQIVQLSDLMANLRALPRVPDLIDEAIGIEPEFGSRLVNQTSNLAMARCASAHRTTVDKSDMALVRRVAVDTLPPFVWRIFRSLHGAGERYAHINTLAKAAHVSIKALRPILQQYRRIHLAECVDATEKVGYTAAEAATWRLNRETLEQCREAGLL